MVVLSDDYYSVPDESMKKLGSILTIVGGRIVHDAGVLRVQERWRIAHFSRRQMQLPPQYPRTRPRLTGYGGLRGDCERSDVVDQRLFLALAGTRIASMNAASAGDTWRRPG